MVKLVSGHNGTGKTRKMIEMSNREVENIQGKMVFLEASNKHIFDLNYKIRYINTKEYGLTNEEQFQGFVCGLIATDYDIEEVYIDGLYKIAQAGKDKMEEVVERLEYLSEKFNVKFIMSVNYDIEDVPESLKSKVVI